ncbi:MAG: cytochrome c oxidase assembly factor Coa1 family protein [Betaproteobacteria bacterium]
MENTSGLGKTADVPAEIDKWNWGAFLLNWIWGIGNNTFIALLMFVPLVNLVMMFVLGAKGSAWAWRNKKWQSLEEFRHIQRQWAKWAIILYIVFAGFFVALFFAITTVMKNSEAFQLGLARIDASREAAEFLGTPVTTGFPMGNIKYSGPNGEANLTLSVRGPRGKGTAYLEATMALGQWKIDRMVLEEDGTGRRIDLGE